jgi:hypothetical protein
VPVCLCADLYAVNDRGDRQFSLVVQIVAAPNTRCRRWPVLAPVTGYLATSSGRGGSCPKSADDRRCAPNRRCRHRSARPRLDSARAGDRPPAAGIALRPTRLRARPSAAYHAEVSPPGLDDIDDDLSRSCGGDMSTPQKCPPTRHYAQTTSDNRLTCIRR